MLSPTHSLKTERRAFAATEPDRCSLWHHAVRIGVRIAAPSPQPPPHLAPRGRLGAMILNSKTHAQLSTPWETGKCGKRRMLYEPPGSDDDAAGVFFELANARCGPRRAPCVARPVSDAGARVQVGPVQVPVGGEAGNRAGRQHQGLRKCLPACLRSCVRAGSLRARRRSGPRAPPRPLADRTRVPRPDEPLSPRLSRLSDAQTGGIVWETALLLATYLEGRGLEQLGWCETDADYVSECPSQGAGSSERSPTRLWKGKRDSRTAAGAVDDEQSTDERRKKKKRKGEPGQDDKYAPGAPTRPRVLEVGAGCGLLGLVLSHLGAQVVLTEAAEAMGILTTNVTKKRNVKRLPANASAEALKVDWTSGTL